MKKIVWTYGLISGAIVAVMMFITMPLYETGTLNLDNGEVIGYTTMVVALSMVFFGIKSYRDKQSNGVISFGKAFKVGIMISLIAAIMYGLAWEITYNTMTTDFLKRMTDSYYEKMKADGASAEELQKAQEKWATFSEWYKNPVVRFGVTIMEILPIGILITLLSAGLLRKKEFLPENSTVYK